MYNKILVADDLSKSALKMLQEAIALARLCKAELTVLNVREDFLNKDEMVMLRVDVSDFQDDIKAKALAVKEKIEKDIISLDGDDVAVQVILREGKARQVISEFADEMEADLIIMGSHGVTGIKEKVFGTTTKAILGQVKRPVLVIWTGD
jgi:nucleotide-binding universal stress UspA family protein